MIKIYPIALVAAMLSTVQVVLALDPAPGTRFEIRPGDLPSPHASPSVENVPQPVERRGAALPRVPPGFAVNVFAADLYHARWLAAAPNGDVFLAEPNADRVLLLRDENGDGIADARSVYLQGLQRPHGLALHDDHLYVADLEAVWRIPYMPGQMRGEGRPQRITKPGAFGEPGGHWTRNLAFSADGSRFYVAIGSIDNIEIEAAPRATIQEFSADGSKQRTFAAGLRNPTGLAVHPATGELYAVVNERDGLGDGLVPDYLTRVRDGGFYGWPYTYIGANPQPGFFDRRPDSIKDTIVPDTLFAAHSAPLGLAFYTGTQFPLGYLGDAFVALRGSWNASAPRGYTVVRVPFENGRPATHYEVFMSGFWVEGERTARVIGRPVGLAVAADGSLLVADDTANVIWRVSYVGAK